MLYLVVRVFPVCADRAPNNEKEALMRYLKAAIVALAAGWLVFLLVVNLENLSPIMALNLGVPFRPLGELSMPLWVGILFAFTAGFCFSLALEIVAWYEYSRMIRRQRQQIRGLQEALTAERAKGSASS
jgi:uncharacterized integral membrane protein